MELSVAIEKGRIDNVRLLRSGFPPRAENGSLAITGHHLIFQSSPQTEQQSPSKEGAKERWLLHKSVDYCHCEPMAKSTEDSPTLAGGRLTLKCKNFQIMVFEIASLDDCNAAARSVRTLSNIDDISLDSAFFHRPPFTVLENGWLAFTTENEFARLQTQCDFWRITNVNKGYQVCPSYPEQCTVPKIVTDDQILASARFREGGRFPVLSYYHKDTRSSVVRCGQPLVGSGNRRCREDEILLNCLLGVASKGYIIDLRSTQAVQQAKSKGGGTEPDGHYPRWKRVHKAVPHWTTLHNALIKLIEACHEPNPDRWLSRLSSCGWLQNVAEVLTCACVVAQCVDREGSSAEMVASTTGSAIAETPVVVHGGDLSVDATLQVTSLATIILDPDARTIRGFESLIEREWVAGGHPFSDRCAHSAYAIGEATGPREAPTFLLFLDCVWQIMQQFPLSFEFTDEMLIFLFDQAYASEYGTFLGNSEYDRYRLNIKDKTVSLWSAVNQPDKLSEFVNPYYEPNEAVLWPCVAPSSLMVWDRLYCRWSVDWTKEQDALKTKFAWKNREKELMSKVVKLRRQLIDLEREAAEQSQVVIS